MSNEVGDTECSLSVTSEILAGDVMDLVIIFIVSILVVMMVAVMIAVLCYLCWRRRGRSPDLMGQKERHNVIVN